MVKAKRHEFSRQSVLWGALFIVALVAAFFVGLVGVLQYFNLVRGEPITTLQLVASIVAVSNVPLIAMGLSISADMNRKKWAEMKPDEPNECRLAAVPPKSGGGTTN
jgi:hypothetical protein